MKPSYDYIIAGAGCAGLSLVVRLLQHPQLQSKKILLVDAGPKNKNDRTWCFWERSAGIFEPIVHHRWNKLNFFSPSVARTMDIHPYAYKMVHGIEFYKYCFDIIAAHPNVEVRYEAISAVGNDIGLGYVQFPNERVYAGKVFNSILFRDIPRDAGTIHLLQHFKGRVIRTSTPSFDPGTATLMDFRVSQAHGTTFVYVMPTSTTEALVEYTLFTEALLAQEEYDQALDDYIARFLNIVSYETLHDEFGIIPMTNHRFPGVQENVVHIGTAGGLVKGSSGYAFRFIQKHSDYLVRSLATGQPLQRPDSRKFQYYDSVFLDVLNRYPHEGAKLFSKIFRKTDPTSIFRFLDNESGLSDDLSIITSLTSPAFVAAGLRKLIR